MIRDYADADADAVLALNEACRPEVGEMDAAKLDRFAQWAPYLRVIDLEGDDGERRIMGLLVGLDQSAPYESPNFGWFVDRFDRFAYIDRIAIAEGARGQGWGQQFYDDVRRWAGGQGQPRLTAEVNVVPPNPASIRFHERYGFNRLAEVEPTGSSDYRVVMLECPLPTGGG